MTGTAPLPRLPFSKAFQAMLAAATTKPCGLGRIPRTAPGRDAPFAKPPYTVIYESPGTHYDDDLADSHTSVVWIYNVTCVARREDQLYWLHDRVTKAMFERNADGLYVAQIEVDGMRNTARRLDSEGGRDSSDGIVSLADEYALAVAPA